MPNHTSILKLADGTDLHLTAWLPEGEPRGVMLLSHGLAEHAGRYHHVAAAFNARGYAVYAPDHRGHGRSGGLRAYFADFDQPVTDFQRVYDHARSAHPAHKPFIYGHSLGSLIALSFCLRHSQALAGAIITGTPLAVESATSPLLAALAPVLSALIPTMPVAPLGDDGISRDPAVVAAYRNDPLVYQGNVRARMANHILQASRRIKARAAELSLPLLILHGAADPICPAAGSAELYQRAGSADKTLKIYPELYHEIHNEPEQTAVLDDVLAWLDAH